MNRSNMNIQNDQDNPNWNEARGQNDKKEPGIHSEEGTWYDRLKNNKHRFTFFYILLIIIGIMVVNSFLTADRSSTEIEYNVFKEYIISGEIKRVEITEKQYIGYSVTRDLVLQAQESQDLQSMLGITTYKTYQVDDPNFIPLLDEYGIEYYAAAPVEPSLLSTIISWVLPLAIMLLIWRFAFSRMNKGMGQGVMSFNQNKSKIVAESDTNTRFSDVAGADESKQELEEVVDFLKNSEKYTAVGGKVPKGVLLVGPPGTGKTLLAKAVAGEAGVPFFKMSGADFVEMFVGVGAARVRDLFRQAREKAPCIIFIDEIDAIGKSRTGSISGNDEREQTLNQLLVEMDGFDSRSSVIILGATNRPEILDPALLRPGRFDRQVLVDKPDLEGRHAILKIHSRDVKLSKQVNLKAIAQATAGLSGADLANIVNESALLAVRNKRTAVEQEDLMEAIEKSIAGLQRKGRVMNEKERERVAYHEVGHALSAHYTEGADPVIKISIIPRGLGALGYTLQQPTEDRFLMSEHELLNSVDILMGGRAAEEVRYGEISTGAGNDISRASDLVRKMITEYGMSEKFRNITLPSGQSRTMLGTGIGGQKEYSEETQEYIDSETARIVNSRYANIVNLLKEKGALLEKITRRLLEIESLTGDEFKGLIDEYEEALALT